MEQDDGPGSAPEVSLPSPGKRTLLTRSVADEAPDARRVGKRTRVWLESCRRAGRALPAPLRNRLEEALGRDLSAITIHDGPAADAGARDVRARAFTVGQDIFFATGEYRPDDAAGQELIAHEVAHAVQQAGSQPTDDLELSCPGDAIETEADTFAAAFARIAPEDRLIDPPSHHALISPVAPVLMMPPPLLAAPSGLARATIARKPDIGADPKGSTPMPPPPGPDGLWQLDIPDMPLAARRDVPLFKRKLSDGTKVSLYDTTIPVNGVPVNLDASFSSTPVAVQGSAGYGPVQLRGMQVFTDCIIPFPIGAKGTGTLDCGSADLESSATVSAGPEISLGAVAGIFKLNAGISILGRASFKAKVESGLTQTVDVITSDVGEVMFVTTMKMRASATAALSVGVGLWVELSLNLPRLPILDKLNSALGGWPSRILNFIGLGASGKLWSKRWTADWKPIEKRASAWTEGSLNLNVSTNGSGRPALSESGDSTPLDLHEVLSQLTGSKPDTDGIPTKEDDAENKPSLVAGARARAASAVRAAHAAVTRERAANEATRAKVAAMPGPHGPRVVQGGMGPASDPAPSPVQEAEEQLEANKETLNELDEGAKALDGAVNDLQAEEGEPAQGPQIKSAYDNVAINAHNLEQKAVEVEQPDPEGDDGGNEDGAAEQARGHARGTLDEVKAVLDGARDWVRSVLDEHGSATDPKIRSYLHRLMDHEELVAELRMQDYYPLDLRLSALGTTASAADYDAVRNDAVELRDDLGALTSRPAEPDYDQHYLELRGGKFELKEPYRSNIRKEFYEIDGYGDDILDWKELLLTTPRSLGGLRHETEEYLWWYSRGDARGYHARAEATIAHESPACAGHWNATGWQSSQDERTTMYRGGSDFRSKLFLQPRHINSSDGGGRPDGTYRKDVSGTWSGD